MEFCTKAKVFQSYFCDAILVKILWAKNILKFIIMTNNNKLFLSWLLPPIRKMPAQKLYLFIYESNNCMTDNKAYMHYVSVEKSRLWQTYAKTLLNEVSNLVNLQREKWQLCSSSDLACRIYEYFL